MTHKQKAATSEREEATADSQEIQSHPFSPPNSILPYHHQLESCIQDDEKNVCRPPARGGGGGGNDSESDESSPSNAVIIKELRNVQRQNSITHYLLTALIIVTLGWQLSEVSLIFKIKEGFSHPFKSLGGIIKGLLPKPSPQHLEKQVAAIDFEPPSLKMPDLSYLGLPPAFDNSDDDD